MCGKKSEWRLTMGQESKRDILNSEKDIDEAGEMAKNVFVILFAGCVLFMVAAVLIGIFEFIPRN